MARYSWPSQPAILLFDTKCQLLYSNHNGRLLQRPTSNGSPRPSRDIGFEIKRLCLRLKKALDSCQTRFLPAENGEGPPNSLLESLSFDEDDVQYRLEASIIESELSKEPCFLIVVGVEEQKPAAQIDLTHYQTEYKL